MTTSKKGMNTAPVFSLTSHFCTMMESPELHQVGKAFKAAKEIADIELLQSSLNLQFFSLFSLACDANEIQKVVALCLMGF